ncbi:DNA polymerase eta-like [Penaeus chinensis]|uniref:DNA polymerase eta-like n=1 Tax=Penaeus chinensis TaxID=139456 RepID=UPI001FB63D95|nr:DNA polymerase eta-like [Penaeus chinensis]XP_047471861.1 DNA polymerase eta-like [Penaeus chinensis]
MTDRVVVLLDMDCFYVQVEERDNPQIKGVPAAVVQYNSWKGGGIIAVNYEARAFGVKRGMRGDEARGKCPDIHLVQVPVNRGKANLTKYRDAGKEVIKVLCEFSDCVERASIDEAYIELTQTVGERIQKNKGTRITGDMLKSSWVVGYDKTEDGDQQEVREKGVLEWLNNVFENEEDAALPLDSNHPHWDNVRLAYAALICEEMRAAVLAQTGFKCSAGITHNKMLSKLACGLHKPNQQTVLPQDEVSQLWDGLPVGKVRHLGGKLGDSLTEEMGCNTMGDLGKLSLQQLIGRYDNKTAHWLFNLGKGVDAEQVTSRQLPKSIGCGKNFQGREALNTQEKVQKWMRSLSDELSERLMMDQTANKRRAKTITVSVRLDGDERWTSLSRSCNLPSYSAERITQVAISLIQHTNEAPPKDSVWSPAIKNISLSAGKFEDWAGAGSGNIQEMFKRAAKASITSTVPSSLVTDWSMDESLISIENKRTQCSSHDFSMESNLVHEASPLVKENTLAKTKVIPKDNLEHNPKKPQDVGAGSSNSFFRNFLLRKQMKSSDVSEEKETLANSVPGADNIQVDESAEEGENADLDLLVSQLEENEKGEEADNGQDNNSEIDSNSDDDSIYQASTDIDSSFATQNNASQDLFMDYDISNEEKGNVQVQVEIDEANIDPLDNYEAERTLDGLQGEAQIGHNHNLETNSGSKVSVHELFPDLDNFDESLLPMLPSDLRTEVEKALAAHKVRTEVKPKKTGLWKYVTSSPSKSTSSPNKQATSTSVTPQNNRSVIEEGSPQSSTCMAYVNGGIQKASKVLMNCHESPKTVVQERTKSVGSVQNSDDTMECEECGAQISAFDMPEHLDFHVALKLQTDMRQEMRQDSEGSTPRTNRDLSRNLRGKKRGKPSKGEVLSKSSKIQKLDSFFR